MATFLDLGVPINYVFIGSSKSCNDLHNALAEEY